MQFLLETEVRDLAPPSVSLAGYRKRMVALIPFSPQLVGSGGFHQLTRDAERVES
jgi:hypothetical protein